MSATAQEMGTIRVMRIDQVARDMQADGVDLDWEQVEELGEARCAWLVDRLGLTRSTTEYGVSYRPHGETLGAQARDSDGDGHPVEVQS